MSTKKKENTPVSASNSLSMDDVASVISSAAIVRAMQKVDLDYEPTDKEKLDDIIAHPELLARAVGMIVGNRTDAEIAKVFGIKPFTVGFIRENEFVKALCEECFKESIDTIKRGLSDSTRNAIFALQELVNPNNNVTEKVRYLASTAIMQTVLKMNKEISDGGSNTTVNVMQVNNQIPPDASEAYKRAIRDMASIKPVIDTINANKGDEE